MGVDHGFLFVLPNDFPYRFHIAHIVPFGSMCMVCGADVYRMACSAYVYRVVCNADIGCISNFHCHSRNPETDICYFKKLILISLYIHMSNI